MKMKNKEAYVQKMHAKIDEWNADIDRLKAKADQVEADSSFSLGPVGKKAAENSRNFNSE
jgi:hypothetical protein